MIIISWDVGVIHLAYCVLKYENGKLENIDWDEINLIEDSRLKLNCSGLLKSKEICGKKAKYYLKQENIGFCKTHLAQHEEYWSQIDTERLFKENTKHKCTYRNRDDIVCNKKSKYRYQSEYYCQTHYKSEFNKVSKKLSPQPIKNLMVKKYPTSLLQLKLVEKLDKLAQHFAILGIEEIIIENQPSMLNPKMKAIAATLFDYFLIRGFVDKIHNLDIKLVRFMCPSNKLKVNKDNTLEVFKSSNKKRKYKLTKDLSIKYTKQLLSDDPQLLDYLALYKKQDDLCDAYLQGRYYLEILNSRAH